MNKSLFKYWIIEREKIRIKKEAGLPPPWTENEVFQKTYFCNVRREDDRVTKWIRANFKSVVTPFTDMTFARLFNLESTLQLIGPPSDFGMGLTEFRNWREWSERFLETEFKAGHKIWSGAYIISTFGVKRSKISHCMIVINEVRNLELKLHNCTTCHQAQEMLQSVMGLGSFLAAQIIADVKNTVGTKLYVSEDKHTFSAHGPGSLRGLEWYFEEPISPKNYHSKMLEAYSDVEELLHSSENLRKVDMQDLQNCFCEYDKFMRVTNKTGRSKRKYTPTQQPISDEEIL